MDNEFNNNQNQNNTDSNGIAIAGMILGIISVLLCWVPFASVILGIVGLALGINGISKSNMLPQNKGKGMGITGIICGTMGSIVGIICTIVCVTIIIAAKSVYDEALNSYNSYKNEYNSYTTYRNYSELPIQETFTDTILNNYKY